MGMGTETGIKWNMDKMGMGYNKIQMNGNGMEVEQWKSNGMGLGSEKEHVKRDQRGRNPLFPISLVRT